MKYFISFLAAWMFWAIPIVYAIPLHVFIGGSLPTVTNSINHATFNGSSYLRVSDATVSGLGFNTTQAGTISCWVKFNDNNGVYILSLARDASGTFDFVRRSEANGNTIRVVGRNTSYTAVLDMESTTPVTSASGWVHVYAKWNTDDSTGNSNVIYINGVGGQTRTTNIDSSICYAESGNARITIGADQNNTAGLIFNGSLGELWFDDTITGTSLSDFYSGGNAVALGSNGELPTGTPPPIYFSAGGSGPSWNDNSGGTTELSLTGSLGLDPSPPQFP